MKDCFLAIERLDSVYCELSSEPLSRARNAGQEVSTVVSSVYDPGNALYAAYLMKLCFPFIDLSVASSERMGDVIETVLGVCFLATRLPNLFNERVLGRKFSGLDKLHVVLSKSIHIFIGSLAQTTEVFPNSKRSLTMVPSLGQTLAKRRKSRSSAC